MTHILSAVRKFFIGERKCISLAVNELKYVFEANDIMIIGINTFRSIGSMGRKKPCLSYDVAVIQWIAVFHKNRMTTQVITLWRE